MIGVALAGGFVLRAAFEVVGDTLDQFDEALRAGIDHVRLAQHLELKRGLRERRAGGRDAVAQDRTEVVHPVLARALHGLRECREHRQDRALARLAQTVAGILGPATHARGKVSRVDPGEVTHAIAQAEEELRQDRAGIAACAVERGVSHARERLAGVAVGRLAQGTEHGVHREREVGAGVAVGHREHVDLVQVFLARQQPQDPRLQREIEPQPVEAVGSDRYSIHSRPTPLSSVVGQLEPAALEIQHGSVRRDLLDDRAFGQRVAFPVLA